MYYDTTENKTKIYSSAAWGDLAGGWDGIIPNYTTVQRDALTPSRGMMIYNTDYDQIQIYTVLAWSGITGSKGLGIECATAIDCASGFCVDSVCCNTSLDNCSGDCEACNLAGTIGYCTTRANLDNTEVTSTCYYCNGTSDISVAYAGYTGVNCIGSNACFSGSCLPSYCDEDNDAHYTSSVAQCPSGRFQSTVGDDCNESCATCYPGSTSYTSSPDGLDQDCDGTVDEQSYLACTPIYGAQSSFGFTVDCVWTQGGTYKYAYPAYVPTDTTHCRASGPSCSAYTGGFGGCIGTNLPQCTYIAGAYKESGTCPFGQYWCTSTQYNTSLCYVPIMNSNTCAPMTGCTTTVHYQ